MVITFVQLLLDFAPAQGLGPHYCMSHIVVEQVVVLYPTLLFGGVVNICPWEWRENGEDGEIRVQVIDKTPGVLNGLMSILPVTDDEHSVGEDIIFFEQPNSRV